MVAQATRKPGLAQVAARSAGGAAMLGQPDVKEGERAGGGADSAGGGGGKQTPQPPQCVSKKGMLVSHVYELHQAAQAGPV